LLKKNPQIVELFSRFNSMGKRNNFVLSPGAVFLPQ